MNEPCDCCGNDPDECICHISADFPEELIPELDTDVLDFEYYEEYNEKNGDENENR